MVKRRLIKALTRSHRRRSLRQSPCKLPNALEHAQLSNHTTKHRLVQFLVHSLHSLLARLVFSLQQLHALITLQSTNTHTHDGYGETFMFFFYKIAFDEQSRLQTSKPNAES